MKEMSLVALQETGLRTGQNVGQRIRQRINISPEVTEYLGAASEEMQALACAAKAICNKFIDATLFAVLVEDPESDRSQVLVSVAVNEPSLELQESIQGITRECHPKSKELFKDIVFSA